MLKSIHLNDSKTCINSKKDRHENIGNGTIGLNAIKNIVNCELLKNIPFILETPNSNDINKIKEEIELIKKMKNY